MLKRKNEIADPSGIPRTFGPARRLCALLLSLVLILGLLPTSALAFSIPGSMVRLHEIFSSDDEKDAFTKGAAFKREIENNAKTFFYCDHSSVGNISLKETIVIRKGRNVVLCIEYTQDWDCGDTVGLQSLFRVENGGSLTVLGNCDSGRCKIMGAEKNKTRFAVVENGGTLRISKGLDFFSFGTSDRGGAILVKKGGKAYISSNDYDPVGATKNSRDLSESDRVEGAAFIACTADVGGAIYVEDGGYVEIKGGTFLRGSARLGREIYLAETTDKNFVSLKMSGEYYIEPSTGDAAEESVYVEGCADRQIVYGEDMNMNVVKSKSAEKTLKVTSVYKSADGAPFQPFRVTTSYTKTESGEVANDVYILRVGTNANSGENIRCFGIHYKDSGNTVRTQYIYPHEGDANEVYRVAGKMDMINSRVALLKNMTGYTIEGCENGFSFDANAEVMAAYSTSYFLFEPLYQFKELVGIDVCWFYDQSRYSQKQEWACSDLSFFRVKRFNDMNLEGYLSRKPYLSFSGELLAQKTGDVSQISPGQADTILRLAKGERYDGFPMQFYDTPVPYDENSTTYLFELDIADIYGAGIETLAADYGAGKRLTDVVEEMTLAVQYTDLKGGAKEVTIPLITGSLVWAAEEGLMDPSMPIIGIAQQGESLFVKGVLPDLKQFTKFYITYGDGAAKKAGLKLEKPTERQNSRLSDQKDQNDRCNLAGVRVYPGDTKVTRDWSSPASLRLQADPTAPLIYQFTAPDVTGEILSSGERELVLSKNPSNDSSGGSSGGSADNVYLVSVTTDGNDLAATTDDVMISLKYRSWSGELVETQSYSLKENVREYFGYWPGKDGDVAYRYAMKPNSTMEFIVTIDNVEKFVGATLTIKSSGTGKKVDDWQMSALRIRKYVDQGERKAQWDDTLSYTDRIFWRDKVDSTTWNVYPNEVDKKEAAENGALPVVYLCAETPSVTISFNNEGKSVIEENEERDWNALRYSMTFAEAHQDLKFKTTMCEYTVNVQVANNSTKSLGEGDTGSNDLFYFMLDFKNGSSAYVLANQQLEADGFRSGVTESFSIRTNRDYGPLVSIHIIPEHSTDDSLFDKLNIKEITVTKKSNEGISKMWKVQNVGWIGSDYFDKGAENSIKGRPGRSESELAQVFKVTQEGYVANILFALKTGSYGANRQLTGAMTAEVEYYDTNGEWQRYSYDVAEKMYEYAGVEAEWCTVRDEDDDDDRKAKLDPAFMLRGGKTDRFILAIPNLRQIYRVTFKVRADNSTIWNMERLAIYTIESSGLLQINTSGEYQRSNKVAQLAEGKTKNIATLIPGGDQSKSSLGAEQAVAVLMNDHKIEVDMKESTWTSTISREPQSNDDSLNVYVYTNQAVPDSYLSSYRMRMGATCNLAPNDGEYRASDWMTLTPDGTMFYALSIPARGISGVKELELEASAEKDLVLLDHAVVQHVRSGVTINTYTFDLKSTAAQRTNFTPSASSAGVGRQEKQVVKLLFAEDTEEQVLEKEINDIVVAIRYSSTNDAQRTGQQTGGGEVLYSSKYIYLSDLLELKQEGTDSSTQASLNGSSTSQKYTKIKPGMIAEIEFNEAYVGDIVGISLASIGSLRAHIQCACIQSETTMNGKTETQWYNFADEIYVDNAPQILNKSKDERKRVLPVRMTFNTEKSAINMGEGTELSDVVPIRMEVFYLDSLSNTIESTTIEDINTYLTGGGFKSGETATVEFFLKNALSIRYISLEPHSIYSSSAAWKLESVNCESWANGIPNSGYRPKTVNQEILQGNPVRVNLSDVFMRIETSVYSDVVKDNVISGKMNSGADDPVLTVELKSGRDLTIVPVVEGTLPGYGYTVLAVRGESVPGGIEVTCYHITSDGAKVVFTPLVEYAEASYAIRIASEEMPDSYCDVIVKVEAAPKEKNSEIDALVNSSGPKEEEHDDGENANKEGGSSDDTPPET